MTLTARLDSERKESKLVCGQKGPQKAIALRDAKQYFQTRAQVTHGQVTVEDKVTAM
jgi:hypothetical protein